MPWSNQSGGGGGGPWKGGGNGGPWGQGPRNTGGGGGGSQPPDLEELLRRSQDRLRRVLPGGRGGAGGGAGMNPLVAIVIVVAAAAFIGYNFFTFRVEQDEVGVVLRFGEVHRQVQPGLNFRLPYPLETVETPPVTRVNRITIGIENDARQGNAPRDVPGESLVLTADENIVDIDFSVFWKIRTDAVQDYLFNLQNPEGTVKAVAESAMREVVGRSNINPLLTQARQRTEEAVRAAIQETLDSYNAGIQITQVNLLKVDPPAEVIGAFRDVQAARADQERAQNEAEGYLNRVVPEARGTAARILAAASAYRDQTIAEARGQADRFLSVYEAYRTAPEVIRERMYLEAMEQILAGMDKVIIDNEGGQGVVPYLPLGQLAAPSGQRPAASGNQSSSTPGAGQSLTSGSGAN